jgi:glucose-6-phosphate 1-dehydrogenase
MVKNILILRFGNEFFGATWNRHHIDNVQVYRSLNFLLVDPVLISVRSLSKSHSAQKGEAVTLMSLVLSVMSCKTVCATTGTQLLDESPDFALDLLQVLTLLAMERPISFSSEDIRDEKVRDRQ